MNSYDTVDIHPLENQVQLQPLSFSQSSCSLEMCV